MNRREALPMAGVAAVGPLGRLAGSRARHRRRRDAGP